MNLAQIQSQKWATSQRPAYIRGASLHTKAPSDPINLIANQRQKLQSQQRRVPSYTVKYLGIVQGTMGILSRKMALQRGTSQATTQNPAIQISPNRPITQHQNASPKIDMFSEEAPIMIMESTGKFRQPLLGNKYKYRQQNDMDSPKTHISSVIMPGTEMMNNDLTKLVKI